MDEEKIRRIVNELRKKSEIDVFKLSIAEFKLILGRLYTLSCELEDALEEKK